MATLQRFLSMLRLGGFAATAIAVFVLVIGASPVFAQSAAMRPVIVAVPEDFPEGMVPGGPQENIVAVTLREPGQTDIVVLNREYATPAGLAAAIAGLKRGRARLPDPEKGVMVVTRAATQPRTSKARDVMVAALETVLAQPPSRIGNLGPGRWFEFPAKVLGM